MYALLWRAAGPHTPPPAPIAALPAAEQQALYAAAEKVARTRGEEYALSLAEALAQHHHDTRQHGGQQQGNNRATDGL